MSVALISLFDHWSAGNRSLHAVLNAQGIESNLIFFHQLGNIYAPPNPKSFDALIDLLKNLKPELVGISARSQFWWIAVRITRRIKAELGIPVVLGGVHASLNPEEAINVADIICRGEGEAALPELVKRLSEGKPYHDIPGLWARMSDGTITRNKPIIAVEDLTSLPQMKIDRSYFINCNGECARFDPLFDDCNATLYMISASRGCPFRCSFCCESVYKDIFDKRINHIRRRSVDHLFEEFRLVKSRFPNLSVIAFVDEVFHPEAGWMEEFTQRYRDEVGVPFSLMIHPGLLSDKWIESLQQTGVNFGVNFGLQSGSERVRKHIFDRPTSDKSINSAINMVNKYPIGKVVDIIVDNPFETAEDFRQSALMLFKVKRPVSFQVYSMMFYKGLPITNRALEEGHIKENELPGYKEDQIELWIPRLDDPRGDPLKTWLKVLVHLHQLRTRSLLRPSREFNPIPIPLLRLLAKKKNVTHRQAKAAIKAHDLLVKLAVGTYVWGGRINAGKELLRKGEIGLIAKRAAGLIQRGIRRRASPKPAS